jgi:glycosyltransferase involved in cell wall biosynthesis
LIAADHEALQKIPYAFGAFSDGSRVSDLARRMLRQLDGHGVRWPDPFDAKQRGSFAEWLRSPDRPDEKPFLPRLAIGLWGERPDLRQVFPALEGASREGFARWLVASSIGELGPELVARIEDSLRPRAGTQEAGLELMQRRVWNWLAQEGFIAHESLSDDEIGSLIAEAEPFPGTTPLFPRLGRILHRMRRDLQLSYPDPSGRDRLGFALWFATSARLEYALPWRLVGPVVRSLPPRQAAWATAWWARAWWRRRPARRAIRRALEAQVDGAAPAAQELEPAAVEPGCPGVNVIGWTTAPTGVGEACRGSIAALRATGVPHAVWQLGTQAPGERPSGDDGAPYDLDLLHVNADMMETVTRELPPLVTLGRHRVGYWFWELSHFPLALTSAFDHVDEVWAPSRFCFDAYSAVAPVPVRWLPPAVAERPIERRSREELGLPSNGFLFLCAFDARSVPERKNPAAAVAALARAVAQCAVPMHLLVKVNHPDDASDVVEQLRAAARNLPVTLMTTTLSRERTDALIASCDAVVSLHRSEGLGLPLIEAMQAGRPVVATGYGGCCDFLDEGVGWVVRHRLVALDRNHGPYPRGAVWADPDVEHAAELMVEVVTDASARERKTAAARRRVRELYAPEVAGARFRRELERIFAARRAPVATARRLAAVSRAVVAVASSAALSSLG